jgi:integrase
MRKHEMRVRTYTGEDGTPRYCVDVRIDGKRDRKYFPTKREAQKALNVAQAKIDNEGKDALSMSHDLRIAAITIEAKLAKYGKTLRDAGKFYLDYLEKTKRPITVRALADEYLALKKAKGKSDAHLVDLTNRYKVFCKEMGSELVRTVTARQIESWLNGTKLENRSWNNFRSRIGALFAYAVKHEYADENPVLKIEPISFVDREPPIWTPDEIARILEAAPYELVPVIALGSFAGVRPAELARMDWKDIDLQAGEVKVTAINAKTAMLRVITMEPNLLSWLLPYAGTTGTLADNPIATTKAIQKVAKDAGISDWRDDGFRHSFASYHYALYGDPTRTATDLGHSTTNMLFAKYRALVKRDAAKKYFAIYAPAQAENVVSIAS